MPEETPYLVLEDLHCNQTHSNAQSLTETNEHTHTDPQSHAETHLETLSPPDTDTQMERQPDVLRASDADSVAHIETEPGTHSDTHTAIVVQLHQVSAAQAANTER